MKGKYFILLAVLFVLVPLRFSPAADVTVWSEDVQALVAKMIAAGGGERKIEEISELQMSGDITAIMRQDKGSYEVTFKRPRKLRVETKYARSTETRILNGTTGYRGTDTSPLAQVADARYLAMVYQYKHLDLLYGLLHRQYSVGKIETMDMGGMSVMVLHLTDQEGPAMNVAVDASTFLIVKVSGLFPVAGNRMTALASDFSDYREVAGLKLPFRIVNYAGGQKIAETRIRDYLLNPAIQDRVFAP